MPSTIREIADSCGVTKQAVINNLKSMGLWEYHVRVGDHRRPSVVDDEAASAVASAIMARRAPKTEPPKVVVKEAIPAGQEDVREVYEARINDLKAQIRDLQTRLDAESKERTAMTEKVGELAETIRALPSAADVEEARQEGAKAAEEYAARDRQDAVSSERRKIASMGFWERRRYLRNGGGSNGQ